MGSDFAKTSQAQGKLPSSVAACIAATLQDVWPLWNTMPYLDHKRVLRKAQGDNGYSINIEPYRGVHTWIAFGKILKGRASLVELDKVIRTEQPLLLGYIEMPMQLLQLQNVEALVTCWLTRIGKSAQDGQSIEPQIQRLLETLDDLLLSQTSDCTTLVPLAGLNLGDDVGEVDIGNGWCLRKLTNDEISEIASHDVLMLPHYDVVSRFVSTGLIKHTKVPVRLHLAYPQEALQTVLANETQSEIDFIIWSLHVTKSGKVNAVATHRSLPSVLPGMGTSSQISLLTNPFASMNFEKDETEKLKAYHSALCATKLSQVSLAAARLTDAENRLSSADSLLDAVIGLEALLNPRDNAELSFRVAMNYAQLGEAEEHRVRYDTIREVLGARNKVVHGGLNPRVTKDVEKISPHAATARACLRDCLVRFLTRDGLKGVDKLDVDFWLDRMLPPPCSQAKAPA